MHTTSIGGPFQRSSINETADEAMHFCRQAVEMDPTFAGRMPGSRRVSLDKLEGLGRPGLRKR